MPRAWRVKESHRGRLKNKRLCVRCSLNWLGFENRLSRSISIFQVSSGMGSYNSACNGERGGLVGGGGCGTRGGGDGAASGGRDLKSQVSCGDGLA